MVKPPAAGSASAALYNTEKSAILSSLKRRAKIVGTALNKLEGVSCQDLEGAMYAFPSITIPPLAFAAACCSVHRVEVPEVRSPWIAILSSPACILVHNSEQPLAAMLRILLLPLGLFTTMTFA